MARAHAPSLVGRMRVTQHRYDTGGLVGQRDGGDLGQFALQYKNGWDAPTDAWGWLSSDKIIGQPA